jgi:hypothetical protein
MLRLMDTTIHLVEPIASAAKYVLPVLLERLDYRRAMHNDVLTAIGIRVPVSIEARGRTGVPPDGAEIVLNAEQHAALFPVFHGAIRVEPIDALSSQLSLSGTYTVPLGLLGGLADITVLADVAERSLRRFLAELKLEISSTALRRETGGKLR